MNELNAGMEVVKKFIQRWVSRLGPLRSCQRASFPRHPGEALLALRGPRHLIFYKGLLGPLDHVPSEALTCCVTSSQLLYLSDPLSSVISQDCLCN